MAVELERAHMHCATSSNRSQRSPRPPQLAACFGSNQVRDVANEPCPFKKKTPAEHSRGNMTHEG
jgi:hypothetical protein